MPVKLTAPEAASLLPVRGVELGFAEAHVRKPNRKDVLVMTLPEAAALQAFLRKIAFALHQLFCVKNF